ncbi:MAG: RHS repeat-associated core domain-containing protein, partial [Bacteroidaceae bacterium]|nr:RHS repeat-associated core domain-containing protein [Bacteroidaceae bacterium]
RLALVEDASGGEAYYYGKMGEVVKTVRTVMASVADIRTYVYGAEYDSWNRVRKMTYPDGEVVTYHYDEAGQVFSLTSNKQGVESVIVDRIGYDKDGHTVYTKLGNGTETEYTYDDARQRLQEMKLLNTDAEPMMQNTYSYDAVDNILGIANTVNPQELSNNSAKLGGESSHTYQYDALNRLISASGKAKDASYTLDMAYNVMSMPVSKAQTVENSSKAASYTNMYKYEDADHPTAPSQIGHEHYTYDANGNPVRVENDSTDATRELYWDEDNRLMVLSDNGKTSRYTYNHAGERIVKSHGSMEGVYINGAPQGITFHETDEYTLYPASILSVTKNRFTKHYFIGSKRVASRIGSGSFNNMYGVNGSHLTAGQQDYAERLSQIESQKEDYYKKLGIAPGIPTMKGSYADPENTGIGYNTIIKELGDHSVPAEWAQYVKKNEQEGTAPGAPIAWNDPSDPDEALPGYGFVADSSSEEEETYFFHSDHLGSTSYITDKDGNITQYDAYLPYGELLVDEHSSSEEMPYKFNGKEFDEETGLYYYGARYMNPVASIWYGVDPLAEKYPNMSAYVYCAANPIRYIDPDGNEWGITTNNDGQKIIYANIELNVSGNISKEQTEIYKAVIKKEFNRMVSSASDGEYCGEIKFNEPQKEGQLKLKLDIIANENSDAAGMNGYGVFFANIYDSHNKLKEDYVFAGDCIHELLHTANMPELCQFGIISDIKMENISGKGHPFTYKTIDGTPKDIINNVMNNYKNIIDGKKYTDTRPLAPQTLTRGQIDFLVSHIKRLEKGEGINVSDQFWLDD